MGGEVVAATAGEALLADAAMVSSGALTSTLGAGITDAALLGGEYAGGLGLTGGLASGLGSAAALGGEFAGGLGSLAPAFQTAIGQTAAFNPETAAQVAQFANVGAVPTANAALGAGQIGDPALLAQQFGSGIQNVTPGVFNELGAVETADLMKNIDPRMVQGYMPMDTPNAANMAEKARFTEHWVRNPPVFDPSTLATAGQGAGDISAIAGNADKAALLSDAGYGPLASPAELGTTQTNGGVFDLLKNATQPLQNWWDDQNKLTKYGLGGYGALQAAKYLNKQQGVAAPAPYSGPLSKFTYSPDTYRPYTYKPYAAGGPVEEMSRANAIGANTGYPQSDIQQGAYATPWQTPVSRNVVSGTGDANVDQMTGMERMAEGGSASSGDASSGDTGIAALGPMMYSPAMMSSSLVDPAAEYAAAQPTMDMSRQNFQNFLARYQNLPITEAAPPPVVYQGLYAGEGPKAPELNYDPGWGGYSGASGGSVSPAGFGSGGGIANLGGYSDGGRLLRGPGDGMSDNIPANIGGRQPARLADGEFVVPADVVSGLGNGSTDAGAKQLYKMLDKVRSARTGTKKQGKQIKADKYTPA